MSKQGWLTWWSTLSIRWTWPQKWGSFRIQDGRTSFHHERGEMCVAINIPAQQKDKPRKPHFTCHPNLNISSGANVVFQSVLKPHLPSQSEQNISKWPPITCCVCSRVFFFYSTLVKDLRKLFLIYSNLMCVDLNIYSFYTVLSNHWIARSMRSVWKDHPTRSWSNRRSTSTSCTTCTTRIRVRIRSRRPKLSSPSICRLMRNWISLGILLLKLNPLMIR